MIFLPNDHPGIKVNFLHFWNIFLSNLACSFTFTTITTNVVFSTKPTYDKIINLCLNIVFFFPDSSGKNLFTTVLIEFLLRVLSFFYLQNKLCKTPFFICFCHGLQLLFILRGKRIFRPILE